MSALCKMNDRGKQLCEALGTALATDKSYSIIFFVQNSCLLMKLVTYLYFVGGLI